VHPDRRKQYDLQLQGIEYEHYAEPEPDSRYMAAGSLFRMYAKTPAYRMVLEVKLPEELIPTINVDLKVTLADTLLGLQDRRHSFHRREVCGACKGTGSKGGEVLECKFCKGSGSANHLFAHPSGQFEQMTHTVCGMCHGAGFMPQEKCDVCAGKGTNIGENFFAIHVPAGFRDGYSFVVPNAGHMTKDSRVGSVHATVRLALPAGWAVVPGSPTAVLRHSLQMPLLELLRGFSKEVYSPSGEMVHLFRLPVDAAANREDVTRGRGNSTDSPRQQEMAGRGDASTETEADAAVVGSLLNVSMLLGGIEFDFPEQGIRIGSERGPLQVHVSCSFGQSDPLVLFALLEEYSVFAPLALGDVDGNEEQRAALSHNLQERYVVLQHLVSLDSAEGIAPDPALHRLINFYGAHLINLEMRPNGSEEEEAENKGAEDEAGAGLSLRDFDFAVAPADVQFDS